MNNDYIEKREVREFLKTYLTDFFKQHGYAYKPNMNGSPGYLQTTTYGFNQLAFYIVSNGETRLFKMWVRHDEVENIICETGLANRESITKYEFTCNDFFSGEVNSGRFISENDLIRYGEEVKQYLLTTGIPFAEKYSKYENIMKTINELYVPEGDYGQLYTSYGQFLGTGNDRFYRVLIISKLCNDPAYDQKLEKISNIFSQNSWLNNWLPGLEKLKVILGSRG